MADGVSQDGEERWFKVAAEIPAEAEDALLAALGDAASGGAEVLGDEARALYPQLTDMPSEWVRVGVYALASDLPALEKNFQEAFGRLVDAGTLPSSARLLDPESIEPGWMDRWKEYFHVTRASARLTIRPTWEAYIPHPHERVIDLDPGNAFGTGGHATTQLCLEAMDGFLPVSSMLDVGTGSGILSIGAAKLGVFQVVSIDNDPAAVLVAKENVAFNCVDDIVGVSIDPQESIEGEFEVVVANIVSNVLIPMAPVLASKVQAEGVLILSGVLVEEAKRVRAAYKSQGLECINQSQMNGWVGLTLKRGNP